MEVFVVALDFVGIADLQTDLTLPLESLQDELYVLSGDIGFRPRKYAQKGA